MGGPFEFAFVVNFEVNSQGYVDGNSQLTVSLQRVDSHKQAAAVTLREVFTRLGLLWRHKVSIIFSPKRQHSVNAVSKCIFSDFSKDIFLEVQHETCS